jgi:microcystin-dependent protein
MYIGNNPIHAVISDTLPIGSIGVWPGSAAPENWLLCDGAAVSRTTYAELFAGIGTTYGSGDGSTTFNVPNAKGRVAVGKDASQTEFDVLGETGGEKTHTLTVDEMPSHNHPINRTVYAASGSGAASADAYAAPPTYTINTGAVGGGGAHNNLPPYITLNYIIKAKNTVPVEATVKDDLTSTSTTDALSANQGKVLNDRVVAIEQCSGSWTPTVTTDTGAISSYTVAYAQYRKSGKLLHITLDIRTPNIGTAAGVLIFTLPYAVCAGLESVLYGRENAATGSMLQGIASGTTARVWMYNNGSPFRSGGQYIITGDYETV